MALSNAEKSRVERERADLLAVMKNLERNQMIQTVNAYDPPSFPRKEPTGPRGERLMARQWQEDFGDNRERQSERAKRQQAARQRRAWASEGRSFLAERRKTVAPPSTKEPFRLLVTSATPDRKPRSETKRVDGVKVTIKRMPLPKGHTQAGEMAWRLKKRVSVGTE